MINFRFHVVSLIAIFLALALGVVIGAGVIDRGVVNALNNRLDSVEAKSDRIQGENDVLTERNSRSTSMIGDLQPFAVTAACSATTSAWSRCAASTATACRPPSPPRSRPTPPRPARSGSRASGRSATPTR